MSITKYQADVLRFRRAVDLHVGSVNAPGFLSDKEAELCAGMINEEIGETVEKGIRKLDHIETIDGLVDSLYVTLGAGVSIGFDIAAVIPNVQYEPIPTSPVSIFWRGDDFGRLLLCGARAVCEAIDRRDVHGTGVALVGLSAVILHTAVGWGIPFNPFWNEVQRANMDKVGGPIRADGKRLKPPGWKAPDHMPAWLRLVEHSGLSTACPIQIDTVLVGSGPVAAPREHEAVSGPSGDFDDFVCKNCGAQLSPWRKTACVATVEAVAS